MTNENKRFLKTDYSLMKNFRSGFHAFVYSFLLNEGERQRTNTPYVEQKYIMEQLNLTRRKIDSILNDLREDGIIDFSLGYNCVKGYKYRTTKFTLKYQLNESKEETAVSEQTTYEQEPQTETVENHDEQVNNIGMSMMESDGYAPQPTEIETEPLKISYNRTQKKKKEIWQMTYDERLTSAFEEMYDWTLNGGTREKVNDKIYELFDKYDLRMCLSTFVDKYVEWKNAA